MSDGGVFVGFDVLKTSVNEKTKNIEAQLGHMNGDGATDRENSEWWQHVGFVSLPPEADTSAKEAAKAVVIQNGGYDVVVASRDKRGQELAGNLQPGEFCLYAPGKDGKGQARIIGKQDGSLTMMARKGNADGGKGMIVQLDAQGGAIRLINDKGYGIIIDEDGVTITAKGSALTLKQGGDVMLVGTGQTQIDGGGILLGALGIPGVNSALIGPTGLVGVASAKVLIQLAFVLFVLGSLLNR